MQSNCNFFLLTDKPTSVKIIEANENTVGFKPNVQLTLTCLVSDAKPQANVTWYMEDTELKAVFPSNNISNLRFVDDCKYCEK